MSQFLSLRGKPEPASANVLSATLRLEGLGNMPPQSQAELLLERSINHYVGANEQIAARVGSWAGQITLNERLTHLFTTAIIPTICGCAQLRSKWISSGRNLQKEQRDDRQPRTYGTCRRAGGKGERALGSRPRRRPWRRAGARRADPPRVDRRSERERALLGLSRALPIRHRSDDRTAPRYLPRRSPHP